MIPILMKIVTPSPIFIQVPSPGLTNIYNSSSLSIFLPVFHFCILYIKFRTYFVPLRLDFCYIHSSSYSCLIVLHWELLFFDEYRIHQHHNGYSMVKSKHQHFIFGSSTVFTIFFGFPTFSAWVTLKRLIKSKCASGASKLLS
jgi:hypothetical protein